MRALPKGEIMSKLLTALLASAALLACSSGGGGDSSGGGGGNGGGGGGNGDGGGGTTTPDELSGVIAYSDITPTTDGDWQISKLTALGDEIEIRRITNDETGETEELKLFLNGEELDEANFAVGESSLSYSTGGFSKSLAFKPRTPDYWDGGYDEFGSRTDSEGEPLASWEYKAVSYSYSFGKAGGEAVLVKSGYGDGAGDGSIVVDGTNWTAELGDVRLEGELDGTEISGTATLDGMSGDFSGYDGTYVNSEPFANGSRYHRSWGGFTGDDGKDSSFAGEWSHR